MKARRHRWWHRRGSAEEKSVHLATRLFLDNIRRFGRQHELRLGALFNLKSGQLFKDSGLAPKLLAKGKLKMRQSKTRNVAEIERIFERIEQLREEGEAK